MLNILLFPITICRYFYLGIKTLGVGFVKCSLGFYRGLTSPFRKKEQTIEITVTNDKDTANNEVIEPVETTAQEKLETDVPVEPKEEVPMEENIEAPNVEETPVEETPIEETPLEEVPTEETPSEEKANETIGESMAMPIASAPFEDVPNETFDIPEPVLDETPNIAMEGAADTVAEGVEAAIEGAEVVREVLTDKKRKELKKLRANFVKKLKKEAIAASKGKSREDAKAAKINLKKKSKDSYVNDKIDKDKMKPTKQKSDFDAALWLRNKIRNNDFVKYRKNKNTLKREALLINFDGADAEKSDVKILYQYVARSPEGEVIKDYFEAYSKVEVHSYLLSEGFEVYSIKTNKWIQMMHKNANVNNTKIKTKDLIFFITQLSTYVKAGIPIVDSLRILERQYKNPAYKKIFKSVIYDLTMGDNLSEALLKQNVAFPKLFINMVKTSEMTGELPEVLDDMEAYYTEAEETRKQMVTAMMYPSLVGVFATGVIIFIMMYVVPQFVEIYESMDASKIPAFTLAVISVSTFLKKYIIFVIVGIAAFVVLFVYLYRNIKVFRMIVQYIMMKIPIFGNTIIYNEVTMFTKTLGSLLAHNVFITESMEVLSQVTNNEIYKMLIVDVMNNLAKGDKISDAFKEHWAFPIPAYEMLVTGERTGELPEMMAKVSTYYQSMHKEQVTRIKTFIEPALTVFLTVIVGIIILAIIIPMFGMYETIQSY